MFRRTKMKKMFEAMRSALANPKWDGLLVANQGDFLVMDRAEIEGYATPLSEYLWFVRDASTWLTRLYVHPTEIAAVSSALLVHSENPRWPIFHVTASGCREIDQSRVLALTGRLDYRVLGSTVLHQGKLIAWIDMDRDERSASQPVHVRFRSEVELSLEQLSALRSIARWEVPRRYGSQAFPASLVLDDESLVRRIELRKRDVELVLG